MKIALISDTHGMLPDVPKEARIIIHAGDIGVDCDPITWFRDVLYPWARKVNKPIYATFGNHDRIGERHAVPAGCPSNLDLLTDCAIGIQGVNYWFSPWSPQFFDWAFMADEETLAKKYARIPDDTEVIVTHCPPLGAGDVTTMTLRTGSVALAERMKQLPRLRLVVCGHIHEAFGDYMLDGVRVLNVSHVDEMYRPKHKPVVIDLDELQTGSGTVTDAERAQTPRRSAAPK